VAAYGVERAGITGGDVVLVTGAGPIGILSAMYARAAGASTVIISEPNKNRSGLAEGLDIGHVVDPTSGALEDLVGEVTGGDGVDLAVECSGSTPGLASCITQTRKRASIVQTGLHTKPASLDAMALSEKDLTLYGSWCWNMTDWPRIIRLVATGQYPVAKAVTSQIPLDDVVSKGFDTLIDPQGDQLKVLVRAES
jgi:(R,R)-butanediol dehydrogenase/meso-butanediol dehydrogenase/diacetyl reductase